MLPTLPPPNEPLLHLHRQGQQIGPISRSELHRRVRVGEADLEDYFWLPGMEGWETVASHPELFQDLEAPEPDDAGAPAGAGTVMIPRAALGDLLDGDDGPAADDAGNAGTMLIPTALGDEDEGGADERVGAETVRFGPETDLAAELEKARTAAAASGPEPAPEPSTPSGSATTAAAATGTVDDDRLAEIFGDLVEETWQILGAHRFAERLDPLFLGASITAFLDAGWSLMDLESDRDRHHLRFEDLRTAARLAVRLRRLDPDRALRQEARFVIEVAEKSSADREMSAGIGNASDDGSTGSPDPGSLSLGFDSGHAVARIELLLPIDRYVAEDHAVDLALLGEHLRAVVHVLRKTLEGSRDR